MPLKLIYGMKDKVCPMESGLEYKEAKEDPNSIHVTGFPGARHFLIEE
jgi:pimeloyl-ACP methyl ester carboxylesterase